MARHSEVSFFSDGQTALLRDRVFALLEKNGVKMDHPTVLQKLAEAGARVDMANKTVRFPETLLEEVIRLAPSECLLAGRGNTRDLALPCAAGTFHTRSGTGAPFYLDPDTTKKREVMIPDIERWARLIDRLDGIDFIAFPSPSDVPPATADIHALAATLKNTDKHVMIQPYSAESIEYLINLSAAAAGGLEKLKRRPVTSLITCSLTPLDFKYMDLEVIVQAGKLGIPLHAASLPGTGTTSPITIPGTVVLCVAEILVMTAVAQIVEPGTPVVATPVIFSVNMLTGANLQSSVEAIKSKAAAVELVRKALGIPTHTYGWGTDAPFVGAQSCIESTMHANIICSAGCDILGGAGQIEVATAISPVQLVIDEEIAEMLRGITGGLHVDDDTLAWQELLSCEAGDNFLVVDHTVRHCRDGFVPKAFARNTWSDWNASGRQTLLDSAKHRHDSILKEASEGDFDVKLAGDLDCIVEQADRNLLK